MKIATYGTRGSIAVSRPDAIFYGGNTTCLRVISDCVPSDTGLVIDAGTGYRQLSRDLVKTGTMKNVVLFTHWHDDHTGGLSMAPHTHIPTAFTRVYGPKEHGKGPREVLQSLMEEPRFPVNFQKVQHRFSLNNLEHIGTQVLVVHPRAGFHLMPVHVYQRCNQEGRQLSLGKFGRFSPDECMVIWMYKTKHPEYTVSYRFEERPTGKVFVFLTDHENTDGFPMDLIAHVRGADLLIQDCQYSRDVYDNITAGFGHGTPDYCVHLVAKGGVNRLGITHHDPDASDKDIEWRLSEAKKVMSSFEHGDSLDVFACRDYGLYEV